MPDFDGPIEMSEDDRKFVESVIPLAQGPGGEKDPGHLCPICGYYLILWMGDLPNQKIIREDPPIDGLPACPAELTYDCPKCGAHLREIDAECRLDGES